MRSVISIVVLLGLLASLTSAAPSPIEKRSFKVERVRNVNFKGHDGPRQLLKAYQKYSMLIPPDLLAAMQLRGQANKAESKAQTGAKKNGKKGKKGKGPAAASVCNNSTTLATNATAKVAGIGSVTATPLMGDVEYVSPVTIGGQTINLDFDSGSSDLWIFNTQLKAASTTGHQLYDPRKSTTFKMLQGQTFSISYGDGSGAAGNVGTDTVNIGGATVTNQAIEMATAVSRSFVADTGSNGLLGLAFSKLNTVKPNPQKTFFDNVMDSLAEPVFTADLRSNAVGAYEFGRIDTTKFKGQMTFVNVNSSMGFWQFSSTKFAVGNGQVQTGDPAGQAIADTGTTLILASRVTTRAYYSQIPGAVNDAQIGGFTVPCNAQLPDLMLDVGGSYMARVKGSDINFAQVQGNTCFGGVQESPATLQIYGDIFFKSQFVAFHGGNKTDNGTRRTAATLGLAEHV